MNGKAELDLQPFGPPMKDGTTQEAIERGVRGFRRERIEEGVHLARIDVMPGETSTPHYHPSTKDVFYVMSGVLTVAVEVDEGALPPYQTLCARAPESVDAENGKHVHKIHLQPGDILVINAFAVHCTSNLGDIPCSFLCIEGIGEYKFIQVPASATASR